MAYSGCIDGSGERALVVPHQCHYNNYLFTAKKHFILACAQCILLCLTPKIAREKIPSGVNTLSKQYQNMKKNIILTAKIVPLVLIMWVITIILQIHG